MKLADHIYTDIDNLCIAGTWTAAFNTEKSLIRSGGGTLLLDGTFRIGYLEDIQNKSGIVIQAQNVVIRAGTLEISLSGTGQHAIKADTLNKAAIPNDV